MSLERFKEETARRSFRRLYRIWGEEGYLVRYYLSVLENALFGEDPPEGDRLELESKDVGAEDFAEALDRFPVQFEKKLVILRDPQPGHPAVELLVSRPELLNDDTVLVLFSPGGSWDGKTKGAKALESFVDREGLSVRVPALDEKTAAVWVRQQLRRRGRDISPADAEYFLSGASDMDAQLNEIQKLASHGEGPVTREEIDLLCAKTLSARGYELTDALLAGDGPRAFGVLDRLTALRTPTQMLLGTVFSVFGSLYRLSLVSGLSDKEAAAALGMKEFAVRKNRTLLRRLSPEALSGILDACSRADVAAKSTSQEDSVLLTRLLCGILTYTDKRLRR